MTDAKCLRILVVLAACFTVVGCAKPNMRLSEPAVAVLQPRADKATVYFIRPNPLGCAINAAVYDGDAFIGIVPFKQKLPYFAAPGEHTFMVVSEAADFLKANVVAGKTYYIEVVPRMGAWKARFSLAPVTKEALQTPRMKQIIANARPIQNKSAAEQWAKKTAPSVAAKKADYLPKWQAKPPDAQPTLKPTDCE